MTHAEERALERCTAAGMDAAAVVDVARRLARRSKVDTAYRLGTLPSIVGEPWSDTSNGDEVWAICRNQVVVTIMLRRSTQSKTAESLRVSEVVCL